MSERLQEVTAYARHLEELIEAANLSVEGRVLMNALVGMAKEKYHMYNTEEQ